jgi:hypothetical protein
MGEAGRRRPSERLGEVGCLAVTGGRVEAAPQAASIVTLMRLGGSEPSAHF